MFADYAADVFNKHEAAQRDFSARKYNAGTVPEWEESSLEESEQALYKKHLSSEATNFLRGKESPSEALRFADEENMDQKPNFTVKELELFRDEFEPSKGKEES